MTIALLTHGFLMVFQIWVFQNQNEKILIWDPKNQHYSIAHLVKPEWSFFVHDSQKKRKWILESLSSDDFRKFELPIVNLNPNQKNSLLLHLEGKEITCNKFDSAL
jgi:hypothetical protein